MTVATAGLGLLIGLVIGALGGGGGVLTVPALVYLLGQTAQDATTSSVIIVGSTAVVGTLARVRGGIAWRTGLGFGAVGIPTAYLGTLLNQRVSQHVLLLAFAGVTLLAAIAMLLRSRGDDGDDPDPPPGSALRTAVRTRRQLAGTALKVAGCGVVTGFLTGFLGVGGGFLVVPALVIVLRLPMALAIGTSLMIITTNSVASLASRLGVAEVDWAVVAPFAATAIVGTLAGKLVSDRLSGVVLTRAFAVMLLLVGGFVAAQSAAAF
ncbi:sulfite exporter TauE/SafE family protein [Pseudonocardia nigra]|uniref:sulfite exporter TauE/SafE family protein n=1 Tax=Pseudonocardia nigra TaxID=1921578 RepID=UPI001C5F437E|nr:sulfite exporter TauE/SafE family protein [Pseudonocardia nigra]